MLESIENDICDIHVNKLGHKALMPARDIMNLPQMKTFLKIKDTCVYPILMIICMLYKAMHVPKTEKQFPAAYQRL
jgi:hypothetical protein